VPDTPAPSGYVTPHFYESLDYGYIYLGGDFTVQNRRQHDNAMFGKGKGEIPTATFTFL